MSRRFSACAAVVVLGLVTGRAAAHDRTTSYSTWTITGRHAGVSVLLSALDVSRFPWMNGREASFDPQLADLLVRSLRLLADGMPCPVTDGPRVLDPVPGRVGYEWSVDCAATGALEVRSDLLFDLAPAHIHFARLSRDGAPPLERVFTERERSWVLADAGSSLPGTSFSDYLRLGMEHILGGYDHLTFVVALLLVGGTLGEVARVVTGFTVAHSLTLGLAVLGYVRPSPAPVEALVGLSIALVAAENIWLVGARGALVPAAITGILGVLAVGAAAGVGKVPATILAGLALFSGCYFGLLARVARTTSLRWAMAFVFGLVHGFAFASVLEETRLAPARLGRALLGFNLGIEAGQLVLVALVCSLSALAVRRREGLRQAMVEAGSAAVMALGVFWFVRRAYG